MEIDDELFEELRKSHDELMRACQALMQRTLNARKLDKKLDRLMIVHEVEPGFADRAETVKRNIDWEMRKRLANVTN